MSRESNFGYQQDPVNGAGIIRARTTRLLRSWEFPRKEGTIEQFNREIERLSYPAIYALFEGKSKVYVGETKDIYGRLMTHLRDPKEKFKKWDSVLILNDGRVATQSDLNDAIIRKYLEFYLMRLFKANKYNVVAEVADQSLNAMQKYITSAFVEEIEFLLLKNNRISRLLEKIGEEQVFSDELKTLLVKRGFGVEEFKSKECMLDGEKAFIRPGSKKTKGWQITLRGRKEGSLIESFQKSLGLLVVPRNGVLVIPLKEIRDFIKDEKALGGDTIDIFIEFAEDSIHLWYKSGMIDVTKYSLGHRG